MAPSCRLRTRHVFVGQRAITPAPLLIGNILGTTAQPAARRYVNDYRGGNDGPAPYRPRTWQVPCVRQRGHRAGALPLPGAAPISGVRCRRLPPGRHCARGRGTAHTQGTTDQRGRCAATRAPLRHHTRAAHRGGGKAGSAEGGIGGRRDLARCEARASCGATLPPPWPDGPRCAFYRWG